MPHGGLHIDLDGAAATAATALGLPTLDARTWGPRLRYLCRAGTVAEFARWLAERREPRAAGADRAPGEPRFVLTGSGDFHHVAGLWLSAAVDRAGGKDRADGVEVVSFDNHPDWDLRPPRWACGGWLKVALATPGVGRVSVWGCGNFEVRRPARLWRVRDPRLRVHAWAERLPTRDAAWHAARGTLIERGTWRAAWQAWCASRAGGPVYTTIDLDCLSGEHAITNWEQGLFTPDDLAWALGELHAHCRVIGGDVCGAASPATYATAWQRLAAWWDHPSRPRTPALPAPPTTAPGVVNTAALRLIWPALCGESTIRP